MTKKRCTWAESNDELMRVYHDEEWGRPEHGDRELFERLVLECFQAGLSWRTILHKREAFRTAFDSFDARIIATYSEDKLETLMANPAIIRNRRKIWATRTNAQAFLNIQKNHGSFNAFVWRFTDPDALSKALKKEGFSFVGPTIIESFMESVGILNHHEPGCFLAP